MITKSVRGKDVDMGALMAKNGHKRAVGNASMNARGDLLDASGRVIKKFEEMTMDYHRGSQTAVKKVALKDLHDEAVSPQEAWAAQKDAAKRAAEVTDAVLNGHQEAARSHSKRKLIED